MGATPASVANAASERNRPGWDHAHRTVAATMGPTAWWSNSSGRQDFTIASRAFSWVLASLVRLMARWARVRSAVMVVLVRTSVCGGMRSAVAMASFWLVVVFANCSRSVWGAVRIN